MTDPYISRKSFNSAISVILLGLVLIAVYTPYLSWSFAIAPGGDTINLTAPIFCEFHRQLSQINIPVFDWTSFEAIYYSPHIVPYYPFFRIPGLNFCEPTAAANSQDILSVLHVGIFWINLIICGRAFRLTLPTATLFATFASITVNTIQLAVFPTIIASAAWLPLALAGIGYALIRQQLYSGFICLVGGCSMMLMAGPGTNMIAPLFFFAYILVFYKVVCWITGGEWKLMARTLAMGLASLLFIALISSASTINLFLHLSEIIRWTRNGAVIGGIGSADSNEILFELARWRDVFEVVGPGRRFLALGSFELGPIVASLALIGAIRGRRERFVQVFALVASASFCIAFLLPAPVMRLWHLVPGLSHTRHISLLATPFSIACSFLAAFGVMSVLNKRPNLRDLSLSAAILGVCIAASVLLDAQAPLQRVSLLIYVIILASGSVIILLMYLGKRIPLPVVWLTAPLAAVQGILLYCNPHTYISPALVNVTLSSNWAGLQGAISWIAASDSKPERLVFDQSMSQAQFGGQTPAIAAQFRGIPTFGFYGAPRIYWKLVAENFGPDATANYGILGGKYLLSLAEHHEADFEFLHASGPVKVYRIRMWRPWVAIKCGITIPGSIAGFAAPGRLPALAPSLSALLDNPPKGASDCGGKQIEDVRLGVQATRMTWTSPEGHSRVLIVNVPPYAAWTLTIDGTPVPAYNLSDNRVAALIPDGLYGKSELAFEPLDYYYRIAVTIAATLAFFAVIGLLWLRRWTSVEPTRA